MNQTIDQPSPPASKKFVIKETVVIWFLILAGALLSTSLIRFFYQPPHGFVFGLYPWVIAGGRSIANGLNLFSGTLPELPGTLEQLGYIVSMLCTFIIFPTLFFFGLRNRAMERSAGTVAPFFRISTLQVVLGGAITMSVALTSVPIAITQYLVSNSIKKSQAVEAAKDGMMNDINTIAWKLCEYKALPGELKGGGGSFKSCALLPEYTSTDFGNYRFTIQDSTVLIMGDSKRIANSGITTTLDTDYRLRNWTYSGKF